MLHNISRLTVDQDISTFLKYNLRFIGDTRFQDPNWPEDSVIQQLVQKSSGLFIWAATALRFIQEGVKRHMIRNRLSMVLENSGIATKFNAPEKHLDEIYRMVLTHSISPHQSDEEKEELQRLVNKILGSIVMLLSPLSMYSLSTLLNIHKDDIEESLEDHHAILNVPKDPKSPIQLHHPSFRDFLLDKDRCGNFWASEKEVNGQLAKQCIQLMSTSLKEDICNVKMPGIYTHEVEPSLIENHLTTEVQYACQYWIQHLQRSGSPQLQDNDYVHRFLQKHLLHWLEALSWMRKLSEGILGIISLEHTVTVSALNFH
jgi:hypothetical protein